MSRQLSSTRLLSRIACLFILVCVVGQEPSLAVSRKGLQLRSHSGPFSLWGIDLSAAEMSDDRMQEVIGSLNVYAKYGVSGLTISLQPSDTGRGVFAEDGSIADSVLFDRVRRIARGTIDRWLVPVVRVFDSGLGSTKAYERALEEVARQSRGSGDMILNIGNVPNADDLPKFVNLLREKRWRGLIGADFDLATMSNEEVKKRVSAVDVLFLSRDIKDGIPKSLLGYEKPIILTVPLAKTNPRAGEFIREVAQTEGVYLIAQLPCSEGESPRFSIGGRDAESGVGPAWYLEEVSSAQLALHGPIDQSLAASTEPSDVLEPGEKEEGFVPLFDGRTLKGWTVLSDSWQSFSVEDGVIACDGSSPNTYLRTNRRFSDFVLRLEAKISPGGNSGIFVRAPLWGRSSLIAFELQIEGRPNTNLANNGAGGIYSVLSPKVDAMKPVGEWNKYEITCRGTKVRILLNGQLIQDFDMNEVPQMRGRLIEGVIGLQDHSDEVWFRKIRIKEL